MRVEDGGATYDGPTPGFDRALEGVNGSMRVIRIVHDRTAFVTLPPDVVSAVLRSRSAGGEYPRHVTLEFPSGRAERRVVHAAWAGGVTPGGESAREIGVPHALAALLNIQEGDEARFSFGAPDACAVAESVSVSPLSADDWEAVLGQADAMEATLLSQIGLAALGQAVPFYGPGGGKPLSLRVRSITPANVAVARLAPNTELIVEPWSAVKGGANDLDDLDERFAGGIDLGEWLRNYDETKTSTALRLQNPSGECAKMLHTRSRSISYDENDSAAFKQTLGVPLTTAIAVEKETAKEHNLRHGSLVRVFKYVFEREFDLSRTDEDLPSLFLRVMVVENDGIVAPQHVALATMAARALEMFQGDYVRIKEVDEKQLIRPATFTARLRPLLPPLPVGIKETDAPIADILTKRRTLLSIARAFGPLHSVALGFNAPRVDVDGAASTDFLDGCARAIFTAWMHEQASLEREEASASAVVLSSKTPVVFEVPNSSAHVMNAIFELELKYPASERVEDPIKQPVCVPLKDFLDGKFRVELAAPTRIAATNAVRNPAPGVTVWPYIPDDDDFAHIPGESLRAHTEEALKLLKSSLWFDAIKLRETYGVGMAPGVLVTGAKQRGRSRLVKALCKIVAEDIKALSCVVEIDCAELPQPALKTLEALRTAFSAAQDRQPSICYFLNLEHICPANEEEDSKSSDDVYHLASIIAREITELADADAVMCLATTSERRALAQPLRENEVFDYEFEVCKPGMDARRDIMLSYAAHLGVELDAEDAASYAELRTDGYDVPDLREIIDRAVESALDRESGRAGIKILTLDLSKATEGYIPRDQANLRKSDGARGHGIDNYVGGFETIGGYDDVKEVLDEAVALPARYPKIFAQCPLRLPTGVLLFGAPGCGKTAMAKACIVNAKLRSITIKGPELFSKYYGESEGELRRLFRRAQEAAPCALFFDEFEALVPRRGSADGGVTDRMVNQFLTLLDGVDSLVGVFVICATSRPDVVDPALLRPGRLDHVLYLPMPNTEIRVDIMQKLIRDVDIAPDVDLVGLARDMDGCTGADLAAFVDECRNCASRRVIKTYLAATEAGESVTAPAKQPAIESIDVIEAKKFAGKPSLSKEDIAHYDALHAEFMRSRDPKRSSAASLGDEAKVAKQTYAGL